MKKSASVLVLLMLFVVVVPIMHATAESSGSNVPKEALNFLEEVAQIDISAYNVTLVSHSSDYLTPPQLPSFVVQENVKYALAQENSRIDAILHFRNGTFSSCNIYVIEGSPIYSVPQSRDEISKAALIFDNYLIYSGIFDLFAMRNLLNDIDKIDNIVKTAGNVKLEITHESNSTGFLWSLMINGIATEVFSISFLDGNLRGIKDYLCLTTISDDAKTSVSKEEAVNIAREYATNFSWKARMDSDEWVDVKNFVILDSPVKAELSMQPRDGLVLYPYWRVELCLDTIYPGSVSSIQVGLWADTGIVNYCQEISAGTYVLNETETGDTEASEEPEASSPNGAPFPEEQKDSSLEPTENSTESATDSATIAIATAAATIAILFLIFSAKKKHQ